MKTCGLFAVALFTIMAVAGAAHGLACCHETASQNNKCTPTDNVQECMDLGGITVGGDCSVVPHACCTIAGGEGGQCTNTIQACCDLGFPTVGKFFENQSCQGGSPDKACLTVIPTLSQWGLILFGMLLLTVTFYTIRRRGLPTGATAGMLAVLGVGLATVVTSYASVQSERVCGEENDVAVELIQNLLND